MCRKISNVLKRARHWLCTQWLVLGLLGFPYPFLAQQYVTDVHHFSIRDGLSHPHIYQSFQDSRGVMWFVSANGLMVYDGAAFHLAMSWTIPTLPWGIRIRAEDNKGRLWLHYNTGGRNEFSLVDIQTRRVFPASEAMPKGSPEKIVDVSTDKNGLLSIITAHGELWKQGSDNQWKMLSRLPGRTWNFCSPSGNKDTVWLISELDDHGHSEFIAVTAAGNISSRKSISYVLNEAWFRQKDNKLLVVNRESLFWLSPNGDTRQEPLNRQLPQFNLLNQLPPYLNTWIRYDEKYNRLWVNDQGSFNVLDLNNNRRIDLNIPGNIRNIFRIYTDRDGNLWVGTLTGVFRVKVSRVYFKQINRVNRTDEVNNFTNSSRAIVSLSNDELYFVSGENLWKYNQQSDKPLPIYPITGGITDIAVSNNRTLWFMSNHLIRYDVLTNTAKQFTYPERFALGTTFTLYADNQKLWLFNSTGIAIFDMVSATFQDFDQYNGFESLRRAETYHVEPVNANEWWILTSNGLYTLSRTRGVTGYFGSNAPKTNYLPGNNFRHVFRDSAGIYWLATADGLIRWDKPSGAYRLLTTKDGLPDNNLYAVYGDKQGFIWLSSDNGIVQFNPKTSQVKYYQEEDGITNNEFNRISHHQTSDGTIFFGGLNGITAFEPSDFRLDEHRAYSNAQVYLMNASLTSVHNSNNRNLLIEYYEQGKIVLKANENYLSLQFGMPDFDRIATSEYHYELLGDEAVTINSNTPDIQLLGLQPGNYILKVKARNNNGLFSANVCEVPVSIIPPMHQRTWFRMSILLSIGASVIMLFFARLRMARRIQSDLERKVALRTQKIEESRIELEKLTHELKNRDAEKTRFFANVTHEFRTPLALMIGTVNYVLSNTRQSTRVKEMLGIASKSAYNLLGLIDNILMLSTIEQGKIKLNPKETLIIPLIQSLVKDYELLAGQKNIQFKLEIMQSGNYCLYTDDRFFSMIISNLLSNAIKFTNPGGKISLRVSFASESMKLEVADTGRGIHPQDLPHIFDRFFQSQLSERPIEGGTGIGLSLTRELVETMGYSLNVQSVYERGTVFTLQATGIYISDQVTAEVISFSEPLSGNHDLAQPDLAKPELLIAEDNVLFQAFMRELLSDNFSITIVNNGAQVMTHLHQGSIPDMIICDVMMPVMDGFQLMKTLSNDNRYSKIPVVMLTARADEQDEIRLRQLGAVAYLVKPVEEQVLRQVIKEKLRLSTAQDPVEQITQDNLHVREADWLEKLKNEIMNRIADKDLSVDHLAGIMLMSRSKFFVEVKKRTGKTPNQLILDARLDKARRLMEGENKYTIKQILDEIGLSDKSNFINAFKKRFGHNPSWYMK